MMIRYIIEAKARDGNAALSIPLRPDGSLEDDCITMLKEVGIWMRRNGEAVYGSHAWKIPGEGEITDGKLRQLPGGALNRNHAEFKFNAQDIRFTIGKNGSLYAFCMEVPEPGTQLKIKSIGTDAKYMDKPVKAVKLLGYKGQIKWKQEADGLVITCPDEMPFATSVVFNID
jgi:alpha-L-fucosidase